MSEGFFIASRLEDGSVGQPVSNGGESISLFEDLLVAKKVRDELVKEGSMGMLHIYKVNMVFVGEVIL